MNNLQLEKISNDIIANSLPKNLYGNPLLVLMLISIIVNCIRVIQECSKNNNNNTTQELKTNIRSLCSKKSWFTKMRLKKIMRKEMTKDEYRQYSNLLVNAILDKGEHVTDEETSVLLEAINNV